MGGKGKPENLITLDKRSPEEAFAIRSAGGKACACAQKRRKELKETLLELLASSDTQEIICQKLLSGEFNAKTFEVIRDTIGEKPKEVKDVNLKGSVSMMPTVKVNGKDLDLDIGEEVDVRTSSDPEST